MRLNFGALAGLCSVLVFVLAEHSALGADSQRFSGRVALWHNQAPTAIQVDLEPFEGGRYLSSRIVQVGPLPTNLTPDDHGCFCFEVGDERFVFVHTYYYATQAIRAYNKILGELGLPELAGVKINLEKDPTIPTSGSAKLKDGPKIEMTFPNSTLDIFQLDHEIGHLIDYSINPRYRSTADESSATGVEVDALEGGVEEGTANILAALHLGMTGSLVFTDETLDAPPSNDINNFVRFPDLIVTRRQVFESVISGPKFAARYGDFVATIKQNLQDSNLKEYLRQPDEYSSSAVINQPLWQAAALYGFKEVKVLYLETLAKWSETDVTYTTLARQLIRQAEVSSAELAAFLRQEYVKRGLEVN